MRPGQPAECTCPPGHAPCRAETECASFVIGGGQRSADAKRGTRKEGADLACLRPWSLVFSIGLGVTTAYCLLLTFSVPLDLFEARPEFVVILAELRVLTFQLFDPLFEFFEDAFLLGGKDIEL